MKAIPKHLPIALVSLLAAASLTANVALYRDVAALKANPQVRAEQENARLVDSVRRLMVLPDEQPTVATVTDPEQLKSQPFFLKAKKGDKVLIFTAARKAILYDPAEDRIIDAAPLNVDPEAASGPQPATTAAGTAAETPGTSAVKRTKK